MCVATMTIVGISNLYYAANMEQAGAAFEGVSAAKRHPIDVDVHRRQEDADLLPLAGRRALLDRAAGDQHAAVSGRQDL